MAGASSSSSSSASRLPSTVPSDYYWLSPAYDPNMTLTVELRRILQAHNIPLRNASTKAAMVKVFKERIQANRPTLLASLTPSPEPQPQPKPVGASRRRRRRGKPKSAAAAAGGVGSSASSSSSSDESSEDGSRGDGDHGDQDDDGNDHRAAANGAGAAPPKPQSFHPRRAATATSTSTTPTAARKGLPPRVGGAGTNGDAPPAKDSSSNQGQRMIQLEADIECLLVQMVVGEENLQAVVDAAAKLLGHVSFFCSSFPFFFFPCSFS